jgi:ubiquinone/menaquinone biosynthesis C-methylase UbiE
MTHDETYRRVRSQFGRTANAYVESTGHAQGAELAQMVALAHALHPGALAAKTVLDVATGGGHTALAFALAGAQVTATDLTPEMVAAARAFVQANGGEGVRLGVAPAEDLPFADAGFDLVTCRIAAHHFADPERFVREAARVLKPADSCCWSTTSRRKSLV